MYTGFYIHNISETGWPKFAIVKFLGILFFKGDYNIQITTMNMHLLTEIRHIIY